MSYHINPYLHSSSTLTSLLYTRGLFIPDLRANRLSMLWKTRTPPAGEDGVAGRRGAVGLCGGAPVRQDKNRGEWNSLEEEKEGR